MCRRAYVCTSKYVHEAMLVFLSLSRQTQVPGRAVAAVAKEADIESTAVRYMHVTRGHYLTHQVFAFFFFLIRPLVVVNALAARIPSMRMPLIAYVRRSFTSRV